MWLERLVHSLKTGLACLIGFAVTKAFHSFLQFDQWLIVTILVVMCAQLSVGSVFFKSGIRFIGTCAGSLIAVLTLTFLPQNPLVWAAVIAGSGMIFSFFATGEKNYSDAATLGAATTAIILINNNPTLTLTSERFLEISLGILIATLISQFVLPIHARNHLRRNQAGTLRLLAEYYRQVTTGKQEEEKLSQLDESIVQALLKQRQLAQEARRELLGTHFDKQDVKLSLECEKRILRGIDFLNRIYNETDLHALLQKNASWDKFHSEVAATLEFISNQIKNPQSSVKITAPSVSQLKEELIAAKVLNPQEFEYNNALLFCLKNITSLIDKLAITVC